MCDTQAFGPLKYHSAKATLSLSGNQNVRKSDVSAAHQLVLLLIGLFQKQLFVSPAKSFKEDIKQTEKDIKRVVSGLAWESPSNLHRNVH